MGPRRRTALNTLRERVPKGTARKPGVRRTKRVWPPMPARCRSLARRPNATYWLFANAVRAAEFAGVSLLWLARALPDVLDDRVVPILKMAEAARRYGDAVAKTGSPPAASNTLLRL